MCRRHNNTHLQNLIVFPQLRIHNGTLSIFLARMNQQVCYIILVNLSMPLRKRVRANSGHQHSEDHCRVTRCEARQCVRILATSEISRGKHIHEPLNTKPYENTLQATGRPRNPMGAMPYEHRNASKKSKSLTSIFPCDAQRRAYHGAQVVADLFTMRLHLVHLRHELQQPLSRRIAFELIVFSLDVENRRCHKAGGRRSDGVMQNLQLLGVTPTASRKR